MKTRIYTAFSISLALSALPLVGGCTGQSADVASSSSPAAKAEPSVAATSTNAPVANPPSPPAEKLLAAAEDVDAKVAVPAPAATERTLPASLKPTPPTTEIIKLAQAGVDEGVMLNFITNTGSMFVLSSDDIIFLNDIGVPGNVVTSMMQHDQWLKTAAPNQPASVAAQVAAQTAATAAAPSYLNPPPAEPQSEPQPPPAQAEAAPPAANVTNNYFYDSLSPYGTWVEVDGYGRCWQPTVVVVNRGWRPYCDGGRWIYTDHGWYWYSDYSWGAAAFHYGRWFNHARYGWCWWPDTVWAPSWVSFRYSGDYCGWAPLPPLSYYHTGVGFSYYGASVGFSFGFGLSSGCYTYVPWNRFCDNRPWHHRLPSHEVGRVHNNTTVINNYVTGDNNTIINGGIPAERYRQHARAELRPVMLREGKGGTQRGGRSEYLERDSRTLVVSRPRDPGQVLPTRQVSARPPSGSPAASLSDRGGEGRTSTAAPGRERGRLVEDRNKPQVSGAAPANGSSKIEPRVTAAPVREASQSRAVPPPRSTAPSTVMENAGGSKITRSEPPAAPRASTAPNNNVRPTRGVPSSTPSSSLVVIGKRDPNSNNANPGRPSPSVPNTYTPSVPRSTTPPMSGTRSPSSPSDPRFDQNNNLASSGALRSEPPALRGTPTPGYSPRPTQTYSAPPSTTARPIQRRPTPESNRPQIPQGYTAPRGGTPAPSYSAPAVPAPRSTPSPGYTPRPNPAPTFNPQRPAPTVSAPAYTPRPAPATPPPAASAPSSAPVQSRPAPSSNGRGDSGGRNRP